MTDQTNVSTERTQEWVAILNYICQSREIKTLIDRLERENHAFLQTIVKIEEE